MTLPQWFRTRVLSVLVSGGVMVWSASSPLAAGYVVIANKQVTEDSLTKGELQSIYLGEKVKWTNKKYIKFAVLEEGAVYKDFMQRAVGKTPSQFDQHWMRIVTTGKGSMPKTFSEPQQVVDFVARQPYAIGFVPAGQETGSVKIIAIQ